MVRTAERARVGEILLDPGARYTEFVDGVQVEGLIARRRQLPESKLLLSVLMLELWLSTYLPERGTGPASRRSRAERRSSYALVTPVRTEEEPRSASPPRSSRRRIRPTRWVIVDNGSEDATSSSPPSSRDA